MYTETNSSNFVCKSSKWDLCKVSVNQKVNQADLFQINNKEDCDLMSDVIAK